MFMKKNHPEKIEIESSMNQDMQVLYWKQKRNELDFLEQIKEDKEEAAKQAFKEGMLRGEKIGKLKGEVKGEIKLIKFYERRGIEFSDYSSELKYIKDTKFKEVKDYINEHPDETESLIGENLHLFEPMEIE